MLLRSALLSASPKLVSGFTSAALEGASDLGRGASAEAWAAAASALGAPGYGVALASQVHGRDVLVAERPGLLGEADALVSRQPGLLVAVRVADCVPILAAGEGSVAAIHAGWRGLALDVIGAAIEAMGGAMVAAVGPCISAAAYEVGDEVIDGLRASGVPEEVFVVQGPRRRHADLRAAAAWQLRRAGVSQVDVLDACTFNDPRLHSHRRSGPLAGRQAGVIGLRS